MDDIRTSLLNKLIPQNISEVKRLLDYIELFVDSHIDAYRRMKHAGYPTRFGYKYPWPYPSTVFGFNSDGSIRTGKKFDSYSMVYYGKNPQTEVIPIPYSNDVIDSYKVLIIRLQEIIIHVINNKLECIKRQVAGIIPQQIGKSTNTFTSEEINLINTAREEFNALHINKAHADLNLPLKFEPILDKMVWYTHLDENMSDWNI